MLIFNIINALAKSVCLRSRLAYLGVKLGIGAPNAVTGKWASTWRLWICSTSGHKDVMVSSSMDEGQGPVWLVL